jgi:Cu-Zn family superoxide dismutase
MPFEEMPVMRFPVILFAAGLFAVSCGNPDAESVTAQDAAAGDSATHGSAAHESDARDGGGGDGRSQRAAGRAAAAATATAGADDTAAYSHSAMSLGIAGTFEPYREGAPAVVYDTALVPPGATGSVKVESSGERTTAELGVTGFLPNRTYGAHLHTNPCGVQPKDAGPHFQHTHTPGAPAHVAANPVNEVWLDFTTDHKGDARSTARQPWALTSDRVPGSLVIHAEPTKKSGTKAGDAGARIACITLQ